MFKIPKFTEIFGETEITEETKSKFKTTISKATVTESKVEIEEFSYENNLNEEEINDFLQLLDYDNLFYEEEKEEGKTVKTAFIKTSKDVLDSVTDGRWSKMSKEDKSDFLRNYIWDGTKFVVTKKGRLKAAIAGIGKSIKDDLKPKKIMLNLSTEVVVKSLLNSIRLKGVTKDIIKSAIKGAPKGSAIGSIILAVINGIKASVKTDPKTIEKDFANNFDLNLKKAKNKVGEMVNKLKGLFTKK